MTLFHKNGPKLLDVKLDKTKGSLAARYHLVHFYFGLARLVITADVRLSQRELIEAKTGLSLSLLLL